MRLLLFNKPYGVLTRFSPQEDRPTLADHLQAPDFHPAGRLDHDSEGLLLLTDDGRLQARITDPRHAVEKVYWAQVEGTIDRDALGRLEHGVLLKDGITRPARARALDPAPALWSRDPPIRHRAAIPTAWLELAIREGRNRQVRRMTAAVGLPTLRLVRAQIGPFSVEGLAPGAAREATPLELDRFIARLQGASGGPANGRSAARPPGPVRSSGADRPSTRRPGPGPRR
ncbi:MAG: pseudouridine synthase [Pseudomonadota bacterium]